MFSWKIRAALLALGVAALPLAACGDACKDSPHCASDGLCSKAPTRACLAATDADCAGSQACKQHGRCSAKDGACTALRDGSCQASEGCKQEGNCSAYQGGCVSQMKA